MEKIPNEDRKNSESRTAIQCETYKLGDDNESQSERDYRIFKPRVIK